jgi:hypothetical protein
MLFEAEALEDDVEIIGETMKERDINHSLFLHPDIAKLQLRFSLRI